MDWPGTGPHSPSNSGPHAFTDSASSRSDLSRRRFAGTPGQRPGSALAQRLAGSPVPLVGCDDCGKKVVRRVSFTPEHPGWVFIKCKTDKAPCKFWYWEEKYIDLLIGRNLIDPRALLARVVGRDENKDEIRNAIRWEATSTSLESKKTEVAKVDNPQINNEDIEKRLNQLHGAVMEVGFLLKCLIVVVVCFGLAILVKK